MPDPTPISVRLIKVLEEATGFPLAMHGDDAALILDDAGVRRMFQEGQKLVSATRMVYEGERSEFVGSRIAHANLYETANEFNKALAALNGAAEKVYK